MVSYTAQQKDRRRRVHADRRKLARQIAAASGEDVNKVCKVLDSLVQLATKELHERGAFLLHKMVKLRMKSKPARAEGLKSICGRIVPLPPRPRCNIVECGATRGFAAALRMPDDAAAAATAG